MDASNVKSEATLVLRLRRSRNKARDAAAAEIVALLRDRGAHALRGGPLSDVSGVTWVAVDEDAITDSLGRLRALGYTERVELVRPADRVDPAIPFPTTRWKRSDVALVEVYQEPDALLREHAPDRRSFLLECGDGVVRRIMGYRGGPGPLEHRALPVVDARLLVNLVANPAGGRLLDPFAGAGGLLREARASGWTTFSLDVDPLLRHGLAEIADFHLVGDARALPLATGSIDAVATEPPYHPAALCTIAASVAEIARVLRTGGRAALLVALDQAEVVRDAGKRAGLATELDTAIDRKGTEVACFCWVR